MYSTVLLFLKVCMCLEKCDKNRREEEDGGERVWADVAFYFTWVFLVFPNKQVFV